MMRTCAFFTTSRAEFGLLSPLIYAMEKSETIVPLIFAGGSHLSDEYGRTIQEIKTLGFEIKDTFDFLTEKNDILSLAIGFSKAVEQIARIYDKHEFDFVCLLGDRYELLSVTAVAILYKRPIIHIHGGESTEGAMDEQIRHMITKAAHIHFASCAEYAENIRGMGEEAWRVYNTGALGVDNISQCMASIEINRCS